MIGMVLMKEHSSRVENKNHRDMCGRPLFCYILDTLLSCKPVDSIIVNTDTENLKQMVLDHYPDMRVVVRPEHMTKEFDENGRYIFVDILQWTMDQCPGEEHFLQVHTTNPHLKANTIDRAVKTYFDSLPEYDSLFGVTEKYIRLFTKDCKPLCHDSTKMERSQDLEPLYEDVSTIYIFSRDSFSVYNNRIGARPLMFPMSGIEAIDIDWEEDWLIAEAVMQCSSVAG